MFSEIEKLIKEVRQSKITQKETNKRLEIISIQLERTILLLEKNVDNK